MGGIVRGENVGCTNPNPVGVFTYQTNGLLADIESLSYSVRDLTTDPIAEKISSTVLDVDNDCPTGNRLGIGRYVAPMGGGSTLSWNYGTHEIVWLYRPVGSSVNLTQRRRFEVLDPTMYSIGSQYVSYMDSLTALADPPAGLGLEIDDVRVAQKALELSAREVEFITGRFFEPRYMTLKLDGRGGRFMWTGHPIIAIESVTLQNTGVQGVIGTTEVDLSILQIYNRHLTGLYDPDDRDDPKVGFVEYDPRLLLDLAASVFPTGKQNVVIVGVFGYTDYDTTPTGQTPLRLARASATVAARSHADPIGSATGGGGQIKSAKTRDQSITYMTPRELGTTGGGFSAYGDPVLDNILLQYMRPPHLGVL